MKLAVVGVLAAVACAAPVTHRGQRALVDPRVAEPPEDNAIRVEGERANGVTYEYAAWFVPLPDGYELQIYARSASDEDVRASDWQIWLEDAAGKKFTLAERADEPVADDPKLALRPGPPSAHGGHRSVGMSAITSPGEEAPQKNHLRWVGRSMVVFRDPRLAAPGLAAMILVVRAEGIESRFRWDFRASD